jgi:hypothetical protein
MVSNFTSACCTSRLAHGNSQGRIHSEMSSNYLCTNAESGNWTTPVVRVNWSVDYNRDDNHDDNYSLNYGNYSPKSLLSCQVTAPARSWQCGGQGFESP